MVANSKVQDKTPAPATWDDAETLTGMDVEEKANLIAVPHLITGYKFTYNEKRRISYVWCEYELTPGGERKVYTDASATGVRFKMEELHDAKHPGEPFELDKWYDIRLLVPRGLRRSEFDAKDDRGRDVKGQAFYLTTPGNGTRD